MAKNKRQLAQQVLNELSTDKINIDFHIDEREVFLRMDALVNEMARKSFFDNWQVSGPSLDEQYITTWDGDNAIEVVDVDYQPSYLVLPAGYIELPRNAGIVEIWPIEPSDFGQTVVIMSHSDVRMMQNSRASNMQGRLWGYPRGDNFVFGESDVAKRFGETFGVRLAIRDSSAISLTAPYPIPADKESVLVAKLVDWYRKRLGIGSDTVRDSNTVNNVNG